MLKILTWTKIAENGCRIGFDPDGVERCMMMFSIDVWPLRGLIIGCPDYYWIVVHNLTFYESRRDCAFIENGCRIGCDPDGVERYMMMFSIDVWPLRGLIIGCPDYYYWIVVHNLTFYESRRDCTLIENRCRIGYDPDGVERYMMMFSIDVRPLRCLIIGCPVYDWIVVHNQYLMFYKSRRDSFDAYGKN
jgi:hypothetical protein